MKKLLSIILVLLITTTQLPQKVFADDGQIINDDTSKVDETIQDDSPKDRDDSLESKEIVVEESITEDTELVDEVKEEGEEVEDEILKSTVKEVENNEVKQEIVNSSIGEDEPMMLMAAVEKSEYVLEVGEKKSYKFNDDFGIKKLKSYGGYGIKSGSEYITFTNPSKNGPTEVVAIKPGVAVLEAYGKGNIVSSGDETKELTINVIKKVITKPNDVVVTYDGKDHTLLIDDKENGKYYTGNPSTITKTKAGAYSSTVTLTKFDDEAHTEIYEWDNGDEINDSNPITVNLVINKANITSVESTKIAWDGSEKEPSIVVHGVNNEIIDSSQYTIQGETISAISPGIYNAKVVMNDGADNYAGSFDFEWEITNEPTPIKDVVVTNPTYIKGKEQTPTITVYDKNDKVVPAEGYEIEGLVEQENHSIADYSFVIKGVGAYSTLEEGITVNWNIDKVVLTKPTLKVSKFSYTGGLHTVEINDFNVDLMGKTGTEVSRKAKSDYVVTVSLNDKTNYEWADKTTDDVVLRWSIIDDLVIKENIVLAVGEKSNNYRWSNLRSISSGNSLRGFEILGEKIVDVTQGTESVIYGYVAFTAKEPGETIVRVYGDKESVYIKITVKSITKLPDPKQSETLTYNGFSLTPTFSNYDSSILDISGITSGIDAGTYTATFSIKDKTKYCWSDNSTDDKNIDWIINKATVDGFELVANNCEYDGNSHELIKINGTLPKECTIYSAVGKRGLISDDMPSKSDYKAGIVSKTDVNIYLSNESYYPVYYYVDCGNNYASIGSLEKPNKIETTISKAAPAELALNNTTYSGESITLVTGEKPAGSYLYYVSDKKVTVPDISKLDNKAPTRTEAGTYYVYYAGNQLLSGNTDSNYKTGEIKEAVVTIARVSVGEKPTTKIDKVYTGKEFNNGYIKPEGIELSGVTAGTDVGIYEAIYTPDSNHCWSDGSYDAVKVTLTISKTAQPSDSYIAPTLENDKVYTGGPINLLSTLGSATYGTVEYYVSTVSNDEDNFKGSASANATNAGTYYVYYKIVGDENHTDVGPTLIGSINIAKATSILTKEPNAINGLVYDGKAKKLISEGVSSTGSIIKYKLNDGEYDASIPIAVKAGTYNVYYKVVGDDNHTDIDEAGPIEVTIAKASVVLPTPGEYIFNYGEQGFDIPSGASLVSGSDNTKQSNAGKYISELKLDDKDNYEWSIDDSANKEIKWEIKQALIDKVTLNQTSFDFTGDIIVPEIVEVKAGDLNIDANDYKTTLEGKKDKGKYSFTVTSTNTNIAVGVDGVEWSIVQKGIGGGVINITSSDFVYDGKEKELKFNVELNGAPLTLNEDYIIVKNSNKGKEADTYTLSLEGCGNYGGNLSKTWTIAKKEVGITWDNLTKEYTGKEINPTAFTNDVSLELNIVLDRTAINVGTYTATASFKETQKNYTLNSSDITKTFEITRKVINVPEAEKLIFNRLDQVGVKAGEGYTLINNVGNAALDYTAIASLDDNYRWADGTDDKEIAWTIAKAEISSVTLNKSSFDYDGKAHLPDIIEVKAGELVLDSSEYDVSNNIKQTAIGNDYKITVTGKGNFTSSKDANWSIEDKKDLSVASATYVGSIKTYNGSPITVTSSDFKIIYNGTQLNSDEYVVSINNTKTDAGTYTATISTALDKGWINSVNCDWKINQRDISNVSLEKSTYEYTGEAIYPVIKDGELTLVAGVDFTANWPSDLSSITSGLSSNKATLTGKGNYTGTKEISWKVGQISVSISPNSLTYNGQEQVLYTESTNEVDFRYHVYSTIHLYTKDSFSTDIPQAKDAGTYDYFYFANVSGYGTLNEHYKTIDWTEVGGGEHVSVSIAPANLEAVGEVEGNFKIAQAYTGSTIVPKLDVYGVENNDAKLIEGIDYTITYQQKTEDGNYYTIEKADIKNVGTYRAVIVGSNNYTGTIYQEWIIKKSDAICPMAITNLVYNGKDGGQDLVSVPEDEIDKYSFYVSNTILETLEGKTFTQSAKAKDAGTYYVYWSFQGSDNLEASEASLDKYVEVAISKANITSVTTNSENNEFTYNVNGVTPELTVNAAELVLNPNDYIVKKNGETVNQIKETELGEYTYTVVAKEDKNFGGSKEFTFRIVADLDVVIVNEDKTIADITYEIDNINSTAIVSIKPVKANSFVSDVKIVEEGVVRNKTMLKSSTLKTALEGFSLYDETYDDSGVYSGKYSIEDINTGELKIIVDIKDISVNEKTTFNYVDDIHTPVNSQTMISAVLGEEYKDITELSAKYDAAFVTGDWQDLNYSTPGTLEHAFGKSSLYDGAERVQIKGVNKYAKVNLTTWVTLLDDRLETAFEFDNILETYEIPFNPNHSNEEIKEHILSQIKLYSYSDGKYNELVYDDEIKNAINVNLYSSLTGGNKLENIGYEGYTYVVLTLADMYSDAHHLKGCTSARTIPVIGVDVGRYRFKAVFDIYTYDKKAISVSNLEKKEDGNYYLTITANNADGKYVSAITVGEAVYDESKLTYKDGKASIEVKVDEFEPEEKIQITETLTDIFKLKDPREFAYISNITKKYAVDNGLALLEADVFASIVDTSVIPYSASDFKIEYSAGGTITIDGDTYETLNFKPNAIQPNKHQFGEAETELIRITYVGSNEKYKGIVLKTSVNIIDDRLVTNFQVPFDTIEINAAEIESGLYDDVLDILMAKKDGENYNVPLVDVNGNDVYKAYLDKGYTIDNSVITIKDSKGNDVVSIFDLPKEEECELTIKYLGIYEEEDEGLKYKPTSDTKIKVKYTRYVTEMYFDTKMLHEIDIVYDAEGNNLKEAILKDGFIVIYNSDDNPMTLVDYKLEDISYDPTNLDANILKSQDVTVSYAGDDLHQPCKNDLAVRVLYAPSKVNIDLESKTFDGQKINMSITTKPNGLHTAYMIAGLEGDAQGYVSLSIDTSAMKYELLKKTGIELIDKFNETVLHNVVNAIPMFKGHYADGVLYYGDAFVDIINDSLERGDFEQLSNAASSIIEEAKKLGIEEYVSDISKLVELVDTIVEYREKYSVTSINFRLNDTPRNAGLYVCGAITVQRNYIPDIAIKTFVITPKDLNVKWDEELPSDRKILLNADGNVDFNFGADNFYNEYKDLELGFDLNKETTYHTFYVGVKEATMPDGIDLSNPNILDILEEIIKENTGIDFKDENIVDNFKNIVNNNKGLFYISTKPCLEAGAYVEAIVFAGNYQKVMTRSYMITRIETSIALEDIEKSYGDPEIESIINNGIKVTAGDVELGDAIIKFIDLADVTDIQDILTIDDIDELIKMLKIKTNPFVSDPVPTEAETYLMVAYYYGNSVYKPAIKIKKLTIHKAKLTVAWNKDVVDAIGGKLSADGYMLTYTYINHNDKIDDKYTITYPNYDVYKRDVEAGNLKLTVRNILHEEPSTEVGEHTLEFILSGKAADNYRVDNGFLDPISINTLAYTITRKKIAIGWKSIKEIKSLENHEDFDGVLSNANYTLTYTYRGQNDIGVQEYYYIDESAYQDDKDSITINVIGKSNNVGIHELLFVQKGESAKNYDIDNMLSIEGIDNTLAYVINKVKVNIGWKDIAELNELYKDDPIGFNGSLSDNKYTLSYEYRGQNDKISDKYYVDTTKFYIEDDVDYIVKEVLGEGIFKENPSVNAGEHVILFALTGKQLLNYDLLNDITPCELAQNTLAYHIDKREITIGWKDPSSFNGTLSDNKYLLTYEYKGQNDSIEPKYYINDRLIDDDNTKINVHEILGKDMFNNIPSVDAGIHVIAFYLTGDNILNYDIKNKIAGKGIDENTLSYHINKVKVNIGWKDIAELNELYKDDPIGFNGSLSDNKYTLSYEYRGQNDKISDKYYVDTTKFYIEDDVDYIVKEVLSDDDCSLTLSNEAGNHKLAFFLEGKDAKNYDIDNAIYEEISNTLNYIIEKKAVTVKWVEDKDEVINGVYTYIYNGNNDYLFDKFVFEGICETDTDTTYVGIGGQSVIDVGKHNASFAIFGKKANNYCFEFGKDSFLLPYEILVKELEVSWIDGLKIDENGTLIYTYNGEAQYPSNDLFVLSGVVDGDKVCVRVKKETIVLEDTIDVGKHTLELELYGDDEVVGSGDEKNYLLTNSLDYEIIPKHISFTWTKIVKEVGEKTQLPKYRLNGVEKRDIGKVELLLEYYDEFDDPIDPSNLDKIGTYYVNVIGIDSENYIIDDKTYFTYVMVANKKTIIENPAYNIIVSSINDDKLRSDGIFASQIKALDYTQAITMLSGLDNKELLEDFKDRTKDRIMHLSLEASHIDIFDDSFMNDRKLLVNKYGHDIFNKSYFLDLSLYATVSGNTSKEKISNSGVSIDVTIKLNKDSEVVKNIIGNNRNYYLIRIHNGVVDEIAAKLSKDEEGNYYLTFASDKFSTYGLFFKNKPIVGPYVVPNTGTK